VNVSHRRAYQIAQCVRRSAACQVVDNQSGYRIPARREPALASGIPLHSRLETWGRFRNFATSWKTRLREIPSSALAAATSRSVSSGWVVKGRITASRASASAQSSSEADCHCWVVTATKSKQSCVPGSSTAVYDLSAAFTAFKSWIAPRERVYDLGTVKHLKFTLKSVHELSAVVYDLSAIVYCF
jgi:hypothetical protein